MNADPYGLVGTRFGDRYDVTEFLAEGAYGVVYKCNQHFLNQAVAIKFLRNEYCTDQMVLKQFAVEARATSMMSHPSIRSIFDFGLSNDGKPYIVMPYLDGQTIESLVDSNGTSSQSQLIEFFLQLANALAHVHSQKVIHGDVEPANVMIVTEKNQHDVIKLIDFGSALLTGRSEFCREAAGRAHYASPEHILQQPIDERSDIYSLGAFMYKAITGRTLFDVNEVVPLMLMHAKERPASFGELNVSAPAALESLVFKSLEKQPADRFQSMKEISKILTEIQKKAVA